MPLDIHGLSRQETDKDLICTDGQQMSLYKNYSGTYSQLSPDGEYCDCSKEELKKWLELLPHESPHRMVLQDYTSMVQE